MNPQQTLARLYPVDQGRRTEDLDMVQAILDREIPRRVLEIGIGDGRIPRLLSERGAIPEWIGVESNPFLETPPGVRVLHQSALELTALGVWDRVGVVLVPYSTLTLFDHAAQHTLLSLLAREFPDAPVYAEVFVHVLPEGSHRLDRGTVQLEGARLRRRDHLLVEGQFQRTRAHRCYLNRVGSIQEEFEELIYWRSPVEWVDLFGAHFAEVEMFRAPEMRVPTDSILLRGKVR